MIKKYLKNKLESRAEEHKDTFLALLNKNMTEEEQQRLIKTWNTASEHKQQRYHSNPKKLIKDAEISKQTMRKVRKQLG